MWREAVRVGGVRVGAQRWYAVPRAFAEHIRQNCPGMARAGWAECSPAKTEFMNCQSAGQTGKEQGVKVSHNEALATHIDPESCICIREGVGEALTGDRAGRPLSRDSYITPGADVVDSAEGNTDGRAIASACAARRGRRPRHAWTLSVREPGDLPLGRLAWAEAVRIGKAGGRSR